jgi:hypothetical protein
MKRVISVLWPDDALGLVAAGCLRAVRRPLEDALAEAPHAASSRAVTRSTTPAPPLQASISKSYRRRSVERTVDDVAGRSRATARVRKGPCRQSEPLGSGTMRAWQRARLAGLDPDIPACESDRALCCRACRVLTLYAVDARQVSAPPATDVPPTVGAGAPRCNAGCGDRRRSARRRRDRRIRRRVDSGASVSGAPGRSTPLGPEGRRLPRSG